MTSTRGRGRATSRPVTVARTTQRARPRIPEISFRELCRREAESMHLLYGLLFGSTVIGVTHKDGSALLCIAHTSPGNRGDEWDGFLLDIGVGHKGLYQLRRFLREVLEMPEHLAWAVTHLLRPYVLCLAPARRDLRKLLMHDDARVRSETQFHLDARVRFTTQQSMEATK